jgi:ribosome-binding protein aMBF1 (putative translation factor)
MIKNEYQYKITQKLALELEEALRILPKNKEFRALHHKGRQAHLSSLKAQLTQHRAELKEYESLRTGKFNFNKIPSLEQVPNWLIQARIARGLRQEDLAKLLKVKKQQIQHYEATEYAAASLTRIRQVAEILQTPCRT